MNAREEFRAAIQAAGLTAPDEIVDDGKIHRFASNGNPRGDAGWYYLHSDERPFGKFGCWKHGIEVEWSAKVSRAFTSEEKAAWRAKIRESERLRAEAQAADRDRAAATAADMWARATPAGEHPYLTRKQILGYGLRDLDGELLVPMRAGPGAYVGLQRIMPDGAKKFLSGTPAGGAYHVIGKPARDGRVVIAEGFATAATIHAALGCCVVVAFNAGNLLPVARKIRAAMPDAEIVIAADDDAWTEGNPGMAAAEAAAAAVGGLVCAPTWASHRPVKHTDFNDLQCDENIAAVQNCFTLCYRPGDKANAKPASGVIPADFPPPESNNPGSDAAAAVSSAAGVAVMEPGPSPIEACPATSVSDCASALDDPDVLPGEDDFIYASSPMDTAELFQARLPDDGKILFWRGDFYMWNGHRYAIRDQIFLHQKLYRFMAACQTQKRNPETGDFEVVQFTPNKTAVENVMHAMRAVCFIDLPEPPTWWQPLPGDPPPSDLIAFRNGFLRISTRDLLPATPRLFVINSLEFDYDPSAPAPAEWLTFLAGIWGGDPEAVACLQEVFGYMLTDDTSLQKMFMMIGPSRSGKGTILRVLENAVGQHNRVSPSLASLGAEFGLQPLIGKRMGMISDARLDGKAQQQPIVENLLRISGEDTVSVNRKNAAFWTGKLAVRFIMAANEPPAFSDASGALPNRFIMFKFTKTFLGKEDHGLQHRLLQELPSIILWALDGLARLRVRGYLIAPESGRGILKEMQQQASPVSMFVEEVCMLDPAATVEKTAMYEAWRAWCTASGMDHPGTMIGFSRKLFAMCADLGRADIRDHTGRHYHFTGIKIRGLYDGDGPL